MRECNGRRDVTTSVSSPWLLAVDFGTSNIAAAHVNDVTGAVQVLPLSAGANLMSSSVYAQGPARIDVGEVAQSQAAVDPRGYLAAPKQTLSLGQNVFDMGGWDLPAHTVVGELLRQVMVRAQAQHDRPPELVLSHPEGWSPQQVAVLLAAANAVGCPRHLVSTISEPVAAAQYYAHSNPIATGEKIAVFDFGDGSVDVTVLRATAEGAFQVLTARSDSALGGRNLDAAIRNWLAQRLDQQFPALGAALREEPTSDWGGLARSIRKAKELLSNALEATIDVRVGAQHEVVVITRVEFEKLIEPEVLRSVELTRATLQSADICSPHDLAAIYLTGGSSQIPLVQRHLQNFARLATSDSPTTVVAQGAIFAVRVARGQPKPHLGAPGITAPELCARPDVVPHLNVAQLGPAPHNWNGPPALPWQAPVTRAKPKPKRTAVVVIVLSIVAALMVFLVVGAAVVFFVLQKGSGKQPTAHQSPHSLSTTAPTSTSTTTATAPSHPIVAPMDRDPINHVFASYMNGLRDQNMPEFRAATCPRLRPNLLGFYLDGQHLVSSWTMLPYEVPSSSGTDNVVTVQATVTYREASGTPAGDVTYSWNVDREDGTYYVCGWLNDPH